MECLLRLEPHIKTGVALHSVHALVPARSVCSGMRTEPGSPAGTYKQPHLGKVGHADSRKV